MNWTQIKIQSLCSHTYCRRRVSSRKRSDVNTQDKLTIINNGEANMDMREATLKYPTKICRVEESNNFKLTYTMIANTPKTASNNPNIFICYKWTTLSHIKGDQTPHKNNMCSNTFSEYLPSFLSIYNEDGYVDWLENCPNWIDRSNQNNTRRYYGQSIPEADQAVQ